MTPQQVEQKRLVSDCCNASITLDTSKHLPYCCAKCKKTVGDKFMSQENTAKGELNFLLNAQHVGDALCKNAAHSYGINFAKLNEFMIEVESRLRNLIK